MSRITGEGRGRLTYEAARIIFGKDLPTLDTLPKREIESLLCAIQEKQSQKTDPEEVAEEGVEPTLSD